MSLAGWVNSLTHPLAQKKKKNTLTNSNTLYHLRNHDNLCWQNGLELFESIWGEQEKKLAQHYSHINPSLIPKRKYTHACGGYNHAYYPLQTPIRPLYSTQPKNTQKPIFVNKMLSFFIWPYFILEILIWSLLNIQIHILSVKKEYEIFVINIVINIICFE